MNLARVNTFLLAAIIAVNVLTATVPLFPAVLFWWRQHATETAERLSAQLHGDGNIPRKNRLVIPAMLFDEEVHDGPDERTLRKGLWRRPAGTTPDKGGNTVIAAHRFTYTDPQGTFYHLDKLRPGDEIGLYWDGKKYLYKVAATRVTGPEATNIEAPSESPRLTLYTCTPLWLPKDRLVVIAEETQHD